MNSKGEQLVFEKTDKETPLLVLSYARDKIMLGLCACYMYMMVVFVFFVIAFFAHGGSIGRYLFSACAFWLLVIVIPMIFDLLLTDVVKLYRDRVEKSYKFKINPKSFYFANGNINICDRHDCLKGITIRITSADSWLGRLVGGHSLYHFFYWNYKDTDLTLENFVKSCESIGVKVKETHSYLGIVMLICVIMFILDMFLWRGTIIKLFVLPVSEILNHLRYL